MLKRSVDIVFAALLLVFFFPFLSVLAILIKLDSNGPALFWQVRVGCGFKTFKMLKLRSMACGCNGPAVTLGADPRITRIGHWLRLSKLDEVPQLWNVLRGEMSLVGPRPVVPELTAEFRQEYARLLVVRPGLTDPAAVKYCRENEMLAIVPDPLRYFKTVVTPEKLRISSAYLEHAGIWSDLMVMARTVVAVFLSVFLAGGSCHDNGMPGEAAQQLNAGAQAPPLAS